jgi:anti-anti-sigma regulatory factor/HAMP domain-containing protein
MEEQLGTDQGKVSQSISVRRVVSLRGQIIGGQSLALILLLVTVILTSAIFSRMNRAIAAANEEMRRAHMVLEVSKAATDLLAAYTQGAVSNDVADFARNVREAEQSLLNAEERLAESTGSLPQTDPVRIELDKLVNFTTEIRGMVDRMIQRAEEDEWWQIEQFALGTASFHRSLTLESVERLQELTTERRVAAEAEAEAARQVIRVTTLGLSLAFMAVSLGTAFVTVRNIARPVERLVEATGRLATGHLEERVPSERVEEFARLAVAFNGMADQLQASYNQLEQQMAERERLQQDIIEAQQHAIQELSSPVIPVMDTPQGGIIVMPLIGSIDTMRARDITRALLAGIREYRARVVILDITGVPVVDSGVANHLNKTIQAARLKGVQAIVTGISDAVAETIVDLGIDWSGVETLGNLQKGLRAALAMAGLHIEGEYTGEASQNDGEIQ